MADVFISYSSRDKESAMEIVKAIEQQNITCWIDERDIPRGSVFANEIPNAIDSCRVFLPLLSPNSQISEHVQRELHFAINHKKVIVPYELIPFKKENAFEYYLDNIQCITASVHGLQELVQTVCNQLNVQSKLEDTEWCDEEETDVEKDEILKCPKCGSMHVLEKKYEYTMAGKMESLAFRPSGILFLLYSLFVWIISYGASVEPFPKAVAGTLESLLQEIAYSLLTAIQSPPVRVVLGILAVLQIGVMYGLMFFAMACEYRRKRLKRKNIAITYCFCLNCKYNFKVAKKQNPDSLIRLSSF